uniref:Vitelline membrane outer layer 1-like protein n=1 Tax=Oryzias sinensis TaxID=183150 RepID=A0A8C7WWQ8_9TELE
MKFLSLTLFHLLQLSWLYSVTGQSVASYTLTVPNGHQWGDWGAQDMCPRGFYAAGFSLKVSGILTLWLKGSCGGSTHLSSIWGEWTAVKMCETGYLASYMLRVQPPQGVTETITVRLETLCITDPFMAWFSNAGDKGSRGIISLSTTSREIRSPSEPESTRVSNSSWAPANATKTLVDGREGEEKTVLRLTSFLIAGEPWRFPGNDAPCVQTVHSRNIDPLAGDADVQPWRAGLLLVAWAPGEGWKTNGDGSSGSDRRSPG